MTFLFVGAMFVIVVPSRSPFVGLNNRLNPAPVFAVAPTVQMLPLVTPVSVIWLVAESVNERPACKTRLLVSKLPVVMETLPLAVINPLVSTVLVDCKTNEPTPLENVPLLLKLFAQICAPW